MGYLSNKKHKARVNATLKTLTVLFALFTIIGFGENSLSQTISEYRWQMYLILAAMFFYTTFHRYYLYMSLSLILVIINFFAISSSMSIFGGNTDNSTRILYGTEINNPLDIFEQAINKNSEIIAVTNHNLADFELQSMVPEQYSFSHAPSGWKDGFMLSLYPVQTSGRVVLAPDTYGDFIKIKKDDLEQTFVAVNLNKLSKTAKKDALKKLSDFVSKQDNPVVVFGDFGMTAWNYDMSCFTTKNNLKVKNALFDNLRNILIPPHFYILGSEKALLNGDIVFTKLNSLSLFTRF